MTGNETVESSPLHPDLADGDQRRRAQVFVKSNTVTMITICLFLVYYGVINPSYNIIPMVVLFVLVVAAYIVHKYASVSVASAILVWSVLAGLLSLAIVNDGLFDSALQVLPAVLIVGAMLLGQRQLKVLAIVSLLALLALGAMQAHSASFALRDLAVTFTNVFDILVINGATIVLILLVSANLQEHSTMVKQGVLRLTESEERFRTLIDHAPDGFEVVNLDGRFVEVNPATTQQLGYTRDELLRLTVFDIDPNLTKDQFRTMQHLIDASSPARWDSTHRRKDGRTFPVELSISAIRLDGAEHFLTAVRDVTDRKQTEEHLRRSLEEKKVLLREVHHRVRNNLAVISGLLNLQSSAVKTAEEALAALKNSRDRIQAMVLVHNELYKTPDYARVDMRAYVRNLTQQLVQAYGSGDAIRMNTQVEDIILGVDAAIPCGLILNELITNVFKHAFPGDASGEIQVHLGIVEGALYELTVADDGVGLKDDHQTGATLGLSLVRLLAEQLDGTMEVSSGRGVRTVIRFPKLAERT